MNPSDDHHHALPGADALALLHSVTHHLGSALALVDETGKWVFLSDSMRALLKDGDAALIKELADRAVASIRSQREASMEVDPDSEAATQIQFHPMAFARHGLCLLNVEAINPIEPAMARAHTLVEALRRQAVTDPLTGLYNRRYLNREAPLLLEQASASQKPLSLILLDLDHFKRINDEHGHLTGDHVLRIAASRMRAAVRPEDRVCRYGGEEFLVLLPDTGVELAVSIAERIRMRLADPVDELPGMRLTASAGVTSVLLEDVTEGSAAREPKSSSSEASGTMSAKKNPDGETALQAALAAADEALYEAKAAGRDCVRLIK